MNFDLAPRFILDRWPMKGDRVHVLDLAAGAEQARRASRTETLTSAR